MAFGVLGLQDFAGVKDFRVGGPGCSPGGRIQKHSELPLA